MLEFDRVRERLADRCSFAPSAEAARALLPAADPDEVRARQDRTAEAGALWQRGEGPPLQGLRDIRLPLAIARKGGTCDGPGLYAVAETLRAGRLLAAYLDEGRAAAPRLAEEADRLPGFSELERRLAGAIGPRGEVLDAASAELAALRRRLRQIEEAVRERLDGMIRSAAMQGYLQEPIVTIRQNRFVLPVKQEHRAQVPGIVHDQSGSGATLFIEPLAVVQLNNEARRVGLQIEEEEERIRRELSRAIAERGEELEEAFNGWAALDLAFACGRLALDWHCARPQEGPPSTARLVEARHPLLGERAVPIDIHLGLDFRVLVLTGPNTGGKTVALKTLGLLVLMHQAGLQVPAGDGSRLGIFPQVFCDLGDEQSIEQSLSTFSSHMTEIVRIVREVRPGALVLLDELGAGTDPAEGAALGTALLRHLLGAGALVVATTHYSELKHFAYAEREVENASVEFDPETLAPTYRLRIGLPGRSNAFEIAARLGLPEAILADARGRLSGAHIEMEETLRRVEEDRFLAREERVQAERDRAEAERLRRLWEERWGELRAREAQVLAEARQQALAAVQRAKGEADAAIRQLRRWEEERQGARLADAERLRNRLNELRRELRAEAPSALPPAPEAPPGEWKPGDEVFVRSVRQPGEVLAPPDRQGMVMVRIGSLRMPVPADDLRPIHAAPDRPRHGRGAGRGRERRGERHSTAGALAAEKAQQIPLELDVRGLTASEAVERVEKYLDDALLAGRPEVRIVHGKGTGSLRSAVGELLRSHPLVAEWRLGGPGEGGDGASVVRLNAE